MARISIEEMWFSDQRREYLREKIGNETDSVAISLWRTAQKYWAENMGLVPLPVFRLIKYYQHLVDAQLVEIRGDEVYVRGSEEWLTWATDQRASRVAGGKARAKAPRGPDGTFLPADVQLDTSTSPAPHQHLTTSSQLSGSGSGSDKNSSSSKTNTLKAVVEIEDQVYQHYPRKIGKADGLKAAVRVVKTPEDLAAMAKAVKNFRAAMQREARPADKIPYFSTWVNSQWRDWIQPETSEDFSAAKPAAGGPALDPAMAEAVLVGDAIKKYGDARSDQAELQQVLGDELYGVLCRSNMGRLRSLRADPWYHKNIAAALHATRERMAVRASAPPDTDPITNREASSLLNNLGLK